MTPEQEKLMVQMAQEIERLKKLIEENARSSNHGIVFDPANVAPTLSPVQPIIAPQKRILHNIKNDFGGKGFADFDVKFKDSETMPPGERISKTTKFYMELIELCEDYQVIGLHGHLTKSI